MNQSVYKAKILVVDDEKAIREIAAATLRKEGYKVDCAEDGPSALMCMHEFNYDCCIFDIMMPFMSGLDLLSDSTRKYPNRPIIMLTAGGTMDNAVEAIRRGAYDFLTKPVDANILVIAVKRALERRMLVMENRRYKESLEYDVREKTRELAIRNRQLAMYAAEMEDMTVSIVSSLLVAMEAKDSYTAGHSNRVRTYCMQIGQKIGLVSEDMKVLERAAMLHDIGKLVVELSSISKPGPLSDLEWEIVLKHPEVGEHILSPYSFLQKERRHIRSHHERFDGKGYPDGIADHQIPLLTEIISVADAYDAMTSVRSYRRKAAAKEACNELKRSIGTQFSDRVVPVLIKLVINGDLHPPRPTKIDQALALTNSAPQPYNLRSLSMHEVEGLSKSDH